MADLPRSQLRLSDLANRKATPFELVPVAAARAAIAESLGLQGLRKLRFAGEIAPAGARDWALTATLGATVVQPCVITLDPVTTRIDEPVTRNYVAEIPEIDAAEVEMPEDDTIEPLPATLDLAAVMAEALSLALPAFPKSPGADLGEMSVTEPGKTAMTDDDTKPFAGLQSLKDRLSGSPDEDAS